MPKLVGEKKTRSDDIQSMSASVFCVLYPTLADYIVSVLEDAVRCMNNSHSQSTAKHHALETPPPLVWARYLMLEMHVGLLMSVKCIHSRRM